MISELNLNKAIWEKYIKPNVLKKWIKTKMKMIPLKNHQSNVKADGIQWEGNTWEKEYMKIKQEELKVNSFFSIKSMVLLEYDNPG
jgi:hypothetical protein